MPCRNCFRTSFEDLSTKFPTFVAIDVSLWLALRHIWITRCRLNSSMDSITMILRSILPFELLSCS